MVLEQSLLDLDFFWLFDFLFVFGLPISYFYLFYYFWSLNSYYNENVQVHFHQLLRL